MNTIKKLGIAGLAAIVLGLGMTHTSDAATRGVPIPYSTIQSAVNAAATGDTISVAPGNYSENVIVANKSLLIKSTSGAASTKISGNANDGAVQFNNNPTAAPTQTLDGFTIENYSGYGVSGQGYQSKINVQNNVVQNCSMGGIYFRQIGGFDISNNTIQSNSMGIYGNNVVAARITGNLIANSGNMGPGIYLTGCSAYPTCQVFPSDEIVNNTIVKNAKGGMYSLMFPFHNNIVANNGTYGIMFTSDMIIGFSARSNLNSVNGALNPGIDKGCNLVYSNGGIQSKDDMNFVDSNMYKIAQTNITDQQKDPEFCNVNLNMFNLRPNSPALNPAGCGLEGATSMDPSCGYTPAKPTTWGKLRNVYK